MLKDGNVSFHILPIEAFAFNYKDVHKVHKVELEFRPERKKKKKEETGMKNQYSDNTFERKER